MTHIIIMVMLHIYIGAVWLFLGVIAMYGYARLGPEKDVSSVKKRTVHNVKHRLKGKLLQCLGYL